MRLRSHGKAGLAVFAILGWTLLGAAPAAAVIDGLTGTSFSLVAGSGYVQLGDGNNLFFWGFADGNSNNVTVQYPGPTLIVGQGQTIEVTLTNWLPEPVSLVFPGQSNVTAEPGAGAIRGIVAWEAAPGGGTVTYRFTAARAGTFYYQSGTNLDRQLEMGLFGALIVRPADFDNTVANRTAYGAATPASAYDREYLILLSEMDDRFHNQLERREAVDTTIFDPVYWFTNGRNSPDSMAEPNASYLPAQPYNTLPMMHPGERILIRLIGLGRDLHPFHTHSNHTRVIARDGWVLESAPGNNADLGEFAFSMTTVPGGTVDSIFTWTGFRLGWDVYGDPADPATAHGCAGPVDPVTFEDCADHGKPVPVGIPPLDDVAAGDFFSGSPFLGQLGALQPGFGKFNVEGSFFQIWHSHLEKEMTNNDIFPGGIMTFMVVAPLTTPIP